MTPLFNFCVFMKCGIPAFCCRIKKKQIFPLCEYHWGLVLKAMMMDTIVGDMKAIFEFELIEDRETFEMYLKAPEMLYLIHEIRDKMRKIEKYGEVCTLEEFFEFLRNETDFNELAYD